MREIAKKLKISDNGVYYSLQRTAQTRVSSLRNRRLTGPQLSASLNGTRKTAVSTSTVKRRLRDAGLLETEWQRKSHI